MNECDRINPIALSLSPYQPMYASRKILYIQFYIVSSLHYYTLPSRCVILSRHLEEILDEVEHIAPNQIGVENLLHYQNYCEGIIFYTFKIIFILWNYILKKFH